MADLNYHNYKSIAGFIEALQIFACYFENGLDHTYFISAEHDTLFGPNMPIADSPQGKRLQELGWHRDDDYVCWAYFT